MTRLADWQQKDDEVWRMEVSCPAPVLLAEFSWKCAVCHATAHAFSQYGFDDPVTTPPVPTGWMRCGARLLCERDAERITRVLAALLTSEQAEGFLTVLTGKTQG